MEPGKGFYSLSAILNERAVINLISEKGDTFLHGFKFTSVMRTISSLQMSG